MRALRRLSGRRTCCARCGSGGWAGPERRGRVTINPHLSNPIIFLDEWEVDAPQEAVFEALSDSRTYPEWFHLPHIQVQVDGPPEAGTRTRTRFKRKLPLTFEVTSRIVRISPPQELELEVEDDLGGRAVWTVIPQNGKVLVLFDWRS